MDTDAIIRNNVGCGPAQFLIVICLYSVVFLSAWGMMFMSYANYNPGWMSVNMTRFNHTGPSEVLANDASTYIWTKECNKFKACDQIVFNPDSVTIATEWGLVCDQAWIGSLIISIQQAGSVVGSLAAAQLANSKGRKVAIYSCVVLCGLANVVAAFSTSWQMFCVIRCLAGVSLGGMLAVYFPYLQEFLNSWWRAGLAAVPEWNIGLMLFALASWLIKDWRQIQIATGVLALLCLLPAFWMPESLRWLAVNGQVDKAKRVVRKMYKMNGKSQANPDFVDEMARMDQERQRKTTIYTYRSLFVKSLRRRTFSVVVMFFLIAVSYYAIGFGIPALFGNFYVNLFVFAVAPMPAFPIISLLANKLGRKPATFIFLVPASLLSLAVVVVFFKVPDPIKGPAITGLALVTSICVLAGWTAGAISVVEVYPTVVRPLGYGAQAFGSRVGTIVAGYVVPLSFDHIYISYAAIAAMLLLSCGLLLSLPETRDKSLEEIMDEPQNIPDSRV